MKNAFVTGGTGLLGNNLVRQLLARGYRVKALVRDAAKARQQFDGLDVDIVVGDLRQVAGFAAALAGSDVLFHTAAYFRDSYSGGSHTQPLYDVNVTGTEQLLVAAYAAGVRHLVHTSSIAVLGDNGGAVVDERHVQAASAKVDDYYRSKIDTDQRVYAFLDSHPDMWAALVLPGWMHGPGDLGPTSAGQFVLDYMRGKLPGIVDGAFSLVDARDVAATMIAVAEGGRRGERYLAAGQALDMRTLCQLMQQVSGKAAPTRTIPGWVLWGIAALQEGYARLTGKPVLLSLATVRNMAADHGRRFSGAKIEREFGIRFRPLEQTLADELAWYRQHAWL